MNILKRTKISITDCIPLPIKILAPLVLNLILLSDLAICAPGLRDIRLSTDPLLVKAREFDIAFQKPEKANQAKAEEYYLKYLAENPNSPLAPYIFFHLGHMYSSMVFPEYIKKYSFVRDDGKAMRYFSESVKHHPKDKVSDLLVATKICVAAGAPTKDERVKQYIEYHKWLKSLTKEEIADKLWLSDFEEQLNKSRPGWKDNLVKNFLSNRDHMMKIAAMNMVDAANGDQYNPSKRLDMIIKELPDQEPAKMAEVSKENYEKTHPSGSTGEK